MTVALALLAAHSVVQADQPDAKHVSLTIDFGDGVQVRYKELAWREGMTVKGLLDAAQNHARPITYHFRGSGVAAMLTRIDKVENQGGQGRNWIYEVNGRLGDRSFAIRGIDAGDAVLWEYRLYE